MAFRARIYFLSILVGMMMCWTDSVPTDSEERLSIADVANTYNNYEPEGPGTYEFGFEVEDPETDNMQFRDEERKSDGSVTGKYGWVAPDGTVYVVSYIADAAGYRATVETEPANAPKEDSPSPFSRFREELEE